MTMPRDQLFESALSLPQSERADLALQLLQSLVPPGDEVTSDEFGAEFHRRIDAHRRGALASFSLEETRAIVQEKLSQERTR
jgi:putative addiction module component (TIGR02574 family)